MNNVECESCVKRKTMYCPNSFKCYATKDKPYWQNRIMLLEENQQLKEQVECLIKQRDDINKNATEHLEKNINYTRIVKKLRSWLEEDLKEKYRDAGYRNNIIREVLDKLNELEGGKND